MDKNFIGIIILLLIVGSVSGVLYFRDLNETSGWKIDIPQEISSWKGEDIELDEKTYVILETRNVLMRKYTDSDGKIVYLYIVGSDINRRVVHPPEVCYTGGGDEITEKEEIEFSVSELKKPFLVNSFVSKKEGFESLVYYWYKSGDKLTTDYFSQQAEAALNQMMGKAASAALVRVSTSIENGGKEKAAKILQEFSKEIIPFII